MNWYVNRVEAGDKLVGAEFLSSTSAIGDFWRWAYSDLCDDDIKGSFAEWLVGLILDIPMTRRITWAKSDLVTREGIRVEVKSSAWWQSWRLLNADGTPNVAAKPCPEIRFARMKSRDPEQYGVGKGNDSAIVPGFHSDFYVFAIENELNPEKWDARDLRQWLFYMLDRAELEKNGWASISLRYLREHYQAMTASELRLAGRQRIRTLTEQMRSPVVG